MANSTDDRLLSPIPAPSEAQLDAGVSRDQHTKVVAPDDVQPELTDDQINTSIDGNAPHTQPTGEFTGSEYPVDPSDPNNISSVDERLGNVAGVDDLDENGRPRGDKTPAVAKANVAPASHTSPLAKAETKGKAAK